MPRRLGFVTEAQLAIIGRRYGSDDVAAEALAAKGRWQRDMGVLARYGYGSAELAAFDADIEQHAALRAARPDAVTEKRNAVAVRDKHVSRAWAWVDRVKAVLGVLARSDHKLALALVEALPDDDAGLEAGIRALAGLLAESKAKLAADAEADLRLAEVDELCASLRASPSTVQSTRGQTVVDTVQIDMLDGKLYQRMRDLNSAGRSAIRNGDLQASLYEYSFHRLKRSGNPATVPPVSPPAAPPAPAATPAAS